MLIPTCWELIPLGNKKNRNENDFDRAKEERDTVLNQFNAKNGQIRENQQRVVDLDCAKNKYAEYNNNINLFYQNMIANTALPNTQLDFFWHLQFANDYTKVDQSTESRSFEESNWRYTYSYSCPGELTCGKDTSCCYNYGYHYVSDTHYYSIITTIVNEYKNIIQGVGISTMSLNCGYYSRDFQILPQIYMTIESDRITQGDKRTGAIQINFKRDWGSRISANYRIDENVFSTQILIPRNVAQTEAGPELQRKLYQFLIVAIAAFNATGANYNLIQDDIRQRIPLLQKQAEEINTDLQKKEIILSNKRDVFYNSDNEFSYGLKLWLPLFFLVPPVLSILTYFIVRECNKRSNSKEIIHDGNKKQITSITNIEEEEKRPILTLRLG